MKKLTITLTFCVFSMVAAFGQQKLAVGMKAPDWKFTDADKKEFTMNSWAGKVIQLNYVDPDESELNEPFNEAVNKAVDVDKRISRDSFKGFGVVDCKSTWKPNGLIRAIAGKKAKKFNTTILFDYDATLQSLWGLPKDSYSVVILDKNRVCRALYTGKIPESDNEKIIQMILQLTKE
ncbi:MAG TPA: YtfJ family protein [Bacteroidales bacterium]|jgi:predicted transcriptional regulator|nr:YtfJ family protein [Bacteroidales bacterium]